jgi:hypothetical protein
MSDPKGYVEKKRQVKLSKIDRKRINIINNYHYEKDFARHTINPHICSAKTIRCEMDS